MDLWQLRHLMYRQRRKTHADLRRWIQHWPPALRTFVAAIWPAVILLTRGCLAVFKSIVLILTSPWVLLADLLRRGKRVECRWLVYVMVLVLAMGAGNWLLTRVINQRYHHSLATLERYLQFTHNANQVDDIPYASLINQYALSYRIDPALLAAIVACESSFNPDAISQAGARGLMQIMPATWRDLNPESVCRGDHLPPSEGKGCIFDPETNVSSGSRYFRELLDEFDNNPVQALAAYNAGRGTVNHYAMTTGELPPFGETRNYLQNVAAVWSGMRSGTSVDKLWRPQELETWQNRLSLSLLFLWGIAGAWTLLKLSPVTIVRRLR